MMQTMPHATPHQFYRHPQLPWVELRVSTQSPHHYRLHMHEEYSLGLVDQGHAIFTHAKGPHHLHVGSMVLIEPHAWHACNPTQITHWSYRMLYIQADWLHALLDVPSLRFAQRALNDAQASQQLHQLCQQLISGPIHTDDWAQQLRRLLLQPALIQVQHQQPIGPDPVVHAALAHWHQSPDCPLRVQTLAHTQGMSASRFIRHFKTVTGVTPGVYRLNVQLNGARQLLAQGSALADAALAMGFADQPHLQRTFKAHHAATPGCYACMTG